MSKRDYTKCVKEVKQVEVETPVVQEEVVEPEKPVVGVVANCLKLNVRAEPKPTAEALCVLDRDSEVSVYKSESTDEYYKVCTAAGVEGYCVKFFVKVKP